MNILDILIKDVIIHIVSYLKIYDRLKFLSLSKNLHILEDEFYYDNNVLIDDIYHLWYFDKFTNITANNLSFRFPRAIKKLSFNSDFNQNIENFQKSLF